jgi:hypothetical protein
MNTDSDLLTAARESFTEVQLTSPLDATIRRGRQLRGRRRMAGIAGATALAAGAVLTAVALLPGGDAGQAGTAHLASPYGPVRFQTAAWTVTREPDRTVTVLVRQLSDPAGLQRALRDTGLTPEQDANLQNRILGPPDFTSAALVALTIHTADIPKGIGLNLTVQSSSNQWGWSLGLVRATPQCTGP